MKSKLLSLAAIPFFVFGFGKAIAQDTIPEKKPKMEMSASICKEIWNENFEVRGDIEFKTKNLYHKLRANVHKTGDYNFSKADLSYNKLTLNLGEFLDIKPEISLGVEYKPLYEELMKDFYMRYPDKEGPWKLEPKAGLGLKIKYNAKNLEGCFDINSYIDNPKNLYLAFENILNTKLGKICLFSRENIKNLKRSYGELSFILKTKKMVSPYIKFSVIGTPDHVEKFREALSIGLSINTN